MRMKGKWRLNANDLQSATIMLEYRHHDGSMGDVIAVPIGDMTPSLFVRISNSAPEDVYSVLMESNAILYAPVSMSTVMVEGGYDSVRWDREESRVSSMSNDERLDRANLSVMRGSDDVFTLELPLPDDGTLSRLLGQSD